MSNYTKLVAYDTKDGLTTGDPLKRIKGTELDDEFDAISTAIATKANLASPEFTGTPTVPTAAAGTNTTQAASTAFVRAAISALYPVGSIYTNASNSTNPATLLGFGTWTAFAAGKVMVGFDSSNELFNTAEETGGYANAIVVSHTHTATSVVDDDGHDHSTVVTVAGSGSRGGGQSIGGASISNTSTKETTGITVATTVTSTGSDGTNKNYQPYITVYMWKREA